MRSSDIASISSMKVGMNLDEGGGLTVPQILPDWDIRGSERETEKKRKKKKKGTPWIGNWVEEWVKMEAMVLVCRVCRHGWSFLQT